MDGSNDLPNDDHQSIKPRSGKCIIIFLLWRRKIGGIRFSNQLCWLQNIRKFSI